MTVAKYKIKLFSQKSKVCWDGSGKQSAQNKPECPTPSHITILTISYCRRCLRMFTWMVHIGYSGCNQIPTCLCTAIPTYF